MITEKTKTNAKVRSHFASVLKKGLKRKQVEVIDLDFDFEPCTLTLPEIWAKVGIGKAIVEMYFPLMNLVSRAEVEGYITGYTDYTVEVERMQIFTAYDECGIVHEEYGIADWWFEFDAKMELIEEEVKFQLHHLDTVRSTSEMNIENFEAADWLQKCVTYQAFGSMMFHKQKDVSQYPSTEMFLQRAESDLWRVFS